MSAIVIRKSQKIFILFIAGYLLMTHFRTEAKRTQRKLRPIPCFVKSRGVDFLAKSEEIKY